jgi:hypothetical protein
MAELAIPVDKVCWLIVKTREFQAKVEPVEPDPGSNQSERGFREILEDYPDDPVAQQLQTAFRDLDLEERRDLLALLLLGRGDAEDWAEARGEVGEAAEAGLHHRLLEQPLLADYLEEGLSRIGRSCSE